jgi:tetratricopeptide (TPR) repeat protein
LSEAEKAYQHALLLDPDLVEVRYNLGCVWLSEDQLDQAKTTLTAYTLRRPAVVEGWLKLGTAHLRSAQNAAAYLRAGEAAAAERSFAEANRLSPQNPEALTGLGLARLQRNRAPEAAKCFTKALKQQPDYGPALLNLAIVAQEQLNDRRLALQKYREYLALKPIPENAAEVSATVRQLEQELAPPPAHFAVTNLAALAPTVTNPAKPAAAKPVTNLPHNSAASPTDASVSASRSFSANSAAKQAAANPIVAPPRVEVAHVPTEPMLKSAQDDLLPAGGTSIPRYTYTYPAKPAAGNRSEAERTFAQGVQAQRAQHLNDAISAYRRALQSDSSFYDAWYNLGLAATEATDFSTALNAYETALALRPDSLDARYNFALALKQANYPVDAARELEKLLAVYPNDARAHLAVANLYAQQLHEPAKARPHYLKVLETDPRNPQAGAIRYWLADTGR